MSNIQWFPGHMTKGKRLIEKYKSYIDLFLIVVDSRAPYSSIHESFTTKLIDSKKIVIIFSKIDLVHKSELEKWSSHYKKIYNNTLEVDLNSPKDIKKVSRYLKDYFVKNKIKRQNIMVLGAPNVGKSTLINKLANRKVAKVENRPSVTRGVNWITTSENIRIFDTPGILEPKIKEDRNGYNLVFTNSIKREILDLPDIVNYGMNFLIKNYPNDFINYYKLDRLVLKKNLEEIIIEVIKGRKFILKNNEYDYERFYISFLVDLSKGKIGKFIFDFYDKR